MKARFHVYTTWNSPRRVWSTKGYENSKWHRGSQHMWRGEFHVVYTWNRAFTKHVQFNQAWLDEELSDARPD